MPAASAAGLMGELSGTLKGRGNEARRMQPAGHPSHGAAYRPSGVSQYIQGGEGEATWQPAQPVPLSRPPPGLQIARPSRPWRMYGRVVGLVVLAYFFTQSSASAVIFALQGDPWVGAVCGVIAIPFLFGLVAMRRPRVVLLERAVPDPGGDVIHPIASHVGSLRTPIPTRLGRHLLRDDSVLDVPSTGKSSALFALAVLMALGLGILTAVSPVFYIVALPLIIPTVLVGFSIPVMGWWSHSTKRIGLPTRRRDAEGWLMAGILSGLPAIVINSWLFPVAALLLQPEISASALEGATLVISAPVGEEICKAIAVLLFARSIHSPRHGFQVGFTVGLGFAIVENLQYILMSSGGGIAFSFTILVRGIGSIPGHAFWTSLTGVGLGWMLMRQRAQALHAAATAGHRIEAPAEAGVDWKLFDPQTGAEIDPTGGGGVAVQPSGVDVWVPTEEVHKAALWRLPLPRHPFVGLVLAILGHALWNGTSFGVVVWAADNGLSDLQTIGLMLVVTAAMVILVFLIGAGLLGSVREAPDGQELEAYRRDLAELTSWF